MNTPTNNGIIVIKQNLQGEETWRYTGEIISEDQEKVVLQAFFNREDTPFHEILLKSGDRFVETFYLARWYNIFEMHDRDDDQLKGWYCNISYPAIRTNQVISYIDLALDLLVYPDGKQLTLDEDEFWALPLAPEVQTRALSALNEVKRMANDYPKLHSR